MPENADQNISKYGHFFNYKQSHHKMTDGTTRQRRKRLTLLVKTFNRLATLCNHWSDKSSFFFITSIKIVDPSSCSNVSQCLDLFFSLVFLSEAKHFPSFMISFDLRRILISKVCSCCCSTVFSADLSSFSFVCCFNILFNFNYLWNHGGTGGDIWQIHFLIYSAVVFLDSTKLKIVWIKNTTFFKQRVSVILWSFSS